jgi:hypothetical protein
MICALLEVYSDDLIISSSQTTETILIKQVLMVSQEPKGTDF